MADEQKEESTETAIVEIVEGAEVEVERMGETESAQQKQYDATRSMLQEVDKSNYLDDGSSLVDTWDRIVRFNDTNELVRVNILSSQHMLQEAYDEHQRQKIDDNKRLADLLADAKDNPKAADQYAAELYRVQHERKSERIHIQRLAVTVTAMAKEYRSCAMQRALFIHINMIQQFTIMVTASIQRNVKDPHDMRAILEDIKNAKRVCFPSEDRE